VANRRISDLPEIAGSELAEEDLFTVVHVFEVDPALKNKKLTVAGTKQYFDLYYFPRTGGIISGDASVSGNFTVDRLTTTSGLVVTNQATISGLIVQNSATVSGTISGITITGGTIQGSNINGTTITATTVNATSGNFTNFVFNNSLISVALGSAASPSISFSGDSNTGIYSPGANNVALTTDGTERVRIDSSGKVGIGPGTIGSYGVTTLDVNGAGGAIISVKDSSTGARGFLRSDGSSVYLTAVDTTPLIFSTVNTERMRITSDAYLRMEASSGGIQFNGDTAAANALDDYEEGTWTPSLGGTATYTTQVGRYTKIGNLVLISFQLVVNTIGTGSTTSISGLPFGTNGTERSAGSVSYWASLATNVLFLGCYSPSSTSILAFTSATASGATANIDVAIFGNSARVEGSMVYRV